MRKLRNCSAEYGGGFKYAVIDDCGIPRIGEFTVLKSYGSLVVFIEEPVCYGGHLHNEIYLMPKYDFSITTMSHVRKFIEDVTGERLTIREMRHYAETGEMTPGGNFIMYARGYRVPTCPDYLFTE